MSAVTEAPAVRTRTDPRSLPGETGMVERPRRRFLPFDPWHLFLAPLAAVMLLPLLWMVVTSLETEAQTFHFPPILWPGTLAVRQLRGGARSDRRSAGGSGTRPS